ncbi:MAG: glycosyl transferase family 1 [Chitinophagales bacterium]|nr:MAG: glycosyl transferase family 1 [Chitinophagales bacterium]
MKVTRKVLIITYYWPPENGVGVQRIMKFCKYLPQYGIHPVVLTISPERRTAGQPLLTQEGGASVARVHYWFDPARWFSGSSRLPAAEKKAPSKAGRSWLRDGINYLLHFIWLNFFIPDSKIGWYLPARKAIDAIMQTTDISAVLTTGPPYTAHLLGLYVKNKYRLPWIVDARDPWVENVNYNAVYRFGVVKAINQLLEKKVYQKADRIITVGEKIAELIRNKIPDNSKLSIIYNGYDEEEFSNFHAVKNRHFKIGYYGSILDTQIPISFFASVGRLVKDNSQLAEDLIFEFFGPLTQKVKHEIERHIPAPNLHIGDNLPRQKLIEKLGEEQVLFLYIPQDPTSELIVSSKIFEYIRSGWPVLVIGPLQGEAGRIIRMANSGKVFAYDDKEGPSQFVLQHYKKWKQGGLTRNTYQNPVFERKEQTGQLARHFEELLEGKKIMSGAFPG